MVVIPLELNLLDGFFRIGFQLTGHGVQQIQDVVADLLGPFLADGGDGVDGPFMVQGSFDPIHHLLSLFFQDQVHLVEHQPTRLARQLGAVFLKLADDGHGIFSRIGTIDGADIHQVDQHTATLEVLEEADTEASTFGSPFDEARNVGNHKGTGVLATHHAQVWHQGGKGVVGHFRTSGGNGADKGGFASIGQTQHADVGQQQQLQLQGTHFTRGAVALLARRPVDRAFETGVAKTVETALGDQQLLFVVSQITQQLAGVFIGSAGTDRHAQDLVLAAATSTVGALAILATLGCMETLEAIVDQGVEVLVGDQINVATITTVTTIRATVRDVFFTAKAYTTVTTVTGIDSNLDFINKLHR